MSWNYSGVEITNILRLALTHYCQRLALLWKMQAYDNVKFLPHLSLKV